MDLEMWKKDMWNLFKPIIEYGQNSNYPDLKTGDSIVEYIMNKVKLYDNLNK